MDGGDLLYDSNNNKTNTNGDTLMLQRHKEIRFHDNAVSFWTDLYRYYVTSHLCQHAYYICHVLDVTCEDYEIQLLILFNTLTPKQEKKSIWTFSFEM